VTTVFGLPGVNKAVDTVFARKEIVSGRHEIDVNVFGAPAGSLGLPFAAHGRSPTKPHDIAISTKLHDYGLGSRIVVAGHPFTVVGTVSDSTALAGAPNVFMTLPDAQQLAFAGQPVASAIAVAGGLRGHAPPGLVVQSPQTAREDLLRVLKQARSSITLMAVLLWVVAAMIIGSVIYLSVLERQKDFAIFKATGVATSSILAGLAVQAIVLSIIAAVLGAGIATLLGPHFPTPVSNTLKANLVLPAIAVVVGFVASLSGLRRAVSVDPALAFGGP
jgi:putative ABC transport system permease protein